MLKNLQAGEASIVVRDALIRLKGNRVLIIDHFQIDRGQHWCIFGGNGSGKTQFARLIRGELPSGHRFVSYGAGFDPAQNLIPVSFEEQQRLWEKDNRHDVSEFQPDAMDKGTTVASLVRGVLPASPPIDAMLLDLLQNLGISNLADSGIRFLSSGQVRKALIARALLRQQTSENCLIMLDEPLEAIDRISQPQVAALLEKSMGTDSSTLLLCRRQRNILPGITHMAVMEDLRITRLGRIDEVLASMEFKRVVGVDDEANLHIPVSVDLTRPASSAVPPIRLVNVSAFYRNKKVLSDVSWCMERHHHTLIEGPNGCGKSTLLSLIDGENHKAYGQEVYLFGVRRGSGESVWDIKSHFGVISNEIHNKYVKGWKVLEVVVSGFFDSVGLYDESGASQTTTAKAWLTQLGLNALIKAYYSELSFGQQRLVLLARAMVKQPDVLILDEPCVGLDDYHHRLILQAVDAIATQTATQIVFVSHTEGEEPRCINQRLRFTAVDGGGYTLKSV